jgi:ribosomal protein S18 acetylase RimI-like enzyme
VDELIERVLRLQSSLLVNHIPTESITPEIMNQGFLIGEKTHEKLRKILQEPESSLILACKKDSPDLELAGYIILEGISKFNDVVSDPESIKLSNPSSDLLRLMHDPESRYINQIAVEPSLRGQGIGSSLINFAKDHVAPHGLVADILFEPEPYNNKASYQTFLKNGFADSGTLSILQFPVFRPCQTHVMTWLPEGFSIEDIRTLSRSPGSESSWSYICLPPAVAAERDNLSDIIDDSWENEKPLSAIAFLSREGESCISNMEIIFKF